MVTQQFMYFVFGQEKISEWHNLLRHFLVSCYNNVILMLCLFYFLIMDQIKICRRLNCVVVIREQGIILNIDKLQGIEFIIYI